MDSNQKKTKRSITSVFYLETDFLLTKYMLVLITKVDKSVSPKKICSGPPGACEWALFGNRDFAEIPKLE
jgi:hypothetical protein